MRAGTDPSSWDSEQKPIMPIIAKRPLLISARSLFSWGERGEKGGEREVMLVAVNKKR